MNNLAIGYQAAGKLDRALPLFEETLALHEGQARPRPPRHPHQHEQPRRAATGPPGSSTGPCRCSRRRSRCRKAKLGPDHPDTLMSMNNLALGYQAAGSSTSAAAPRADARADEGEARPRPPHTLQVMGNLASWLPGRREARPGACRCCDELADLWKRKAGVDSPQYAGALASLGLNLLLQKKWTEAETVLRDALTIRETKEPDAWTTFNTKSMLGGALLGQKKYADAEPLLKAGYEGMKARAEKIPRPAKSASSKPSTASSRLRRRRARPTR